jgi:hypothetical protein
MATTTNLSLYKPAVGESGWGTLVSANFDTIDGAIHELGVNVTDHGVVCDGTTDDTTALRALVAAVPNGSTLLFPGDCLIVGSGGVGIDISTKSGLRFVGLGGLGWNDGLPGLGPSIFTTTDNLVLFDATANSLNHLGHIFENIRVGSTKQNGVLIDVAKYNHLGLRDVRFINSDIALRLTGTAADCAYGELRNCKFYNQQTSAIVTAGSTSFNAFGGYIVARGATNPTYNGVNLTAGAVNCGLFGVKFELGTNGGAQTALTITDQGNSITGCHFEVSQAGQTNSVCINLPDLGAGTNTGNMIVGNSFTGGTSTGIKAIVIGVNHIETMFVANHIRSLADIPITDSGTDSIIMDHPNAVGAGDKRRFLGLGGPGIFAGTGSPGSVITAPIGSIYLRSDGGASTSIYIKESGTGNTGWVAK